MDDKLCLCICENFKKEILSILEQEMLKDLDVFFYTARCHGAKTENEDLKQLLLSLSKNVQYSRIEVLNSDLCLQRTSCRYPDHKIYFRTEDLCFKFLANSRLIEQLIDEASYITTPSLLEKWEDIILGKWQFDRTNAISFFHESTKKIVFLDTMTKKDDRGTASSLDKEKSFKEMRQFYKRNKNEAACSHSLTEDKKGFLLKIKHKEIILGILMTKEPLMQEYLQKYLSHALSLSAMLGLAISNARRYEELNEMKDKYRFPKLP
jgi:hypothetical protein